MAMYLGSTKVNPIIRDTTNYSLPREVVDGVYQYSKNTDFILPKEATDLGICALQSAFSYHPTLLSLNLNNLTTINGDEALQGACINSRIINLFAPRLQYIYGISGLGYICSQCKFLLSLTLINLKYVGEQGLFAAFRDTALKTVDFKNLETIKNSGLGYCFSFTKTLESINLSRLKEIGHQGLIFAFQGTSLSSLSFPALTSNSFGTANNQFNSMLQDVTGCTVHFPSNLESVIGSWSSVTSGFGGTNTTVLFDLEATE